MGTTTSCTLLLLSVGPASEPATGPTTGPDAYNELCATDDLGRKAAALGALFGRDSG
jgi:hypothetical protein